MPGLFGVVSDRPLQDDVVRRMLSSLRMEPWYQCGTHTWNPRVGVGWISHAGAVDDRMPAISTNRDVALICSGESFHTGADTSRRLSGQESLGPANPITMIDLYETYGDSFVGRLNGWFAGLLVDLRRHKCFLFNDRYGMHRLFLHEQRGATYFSSHAKAILSVCPETRSFDPEGLAEFLTCGCTLANQSLFRGISILPAGSILEFGPGSRVRMKKYFAYQSAKPDERPSDAQFVAEFVESFPSIVRKYAGGSLPVGVSLTGGLDSRMIMAALPTKDRDLPCTTFGSVFRETFDVQVAREVASRCEQRHEVIILGEEFLNDLPKYFDAAVEFSDGYLGLSGAAELFCNYKARNVAQVRLTGSFGGELLRGDRAFKCTHPGGAFVRPEFSAHILGAEARFEPSDRTDSLSFLLLVQAPSQGFGRMAIERSQVVLRIPFMDNELVDLIRRAPARARKGVSLSTEVIRRLRPELLEIPTDRGFRWPDTSPRRMIRRLHREALFKAEYWSSHGMPAGLAWLASGSVGNSLERTFLGRHKFQHFRTWTRGRFQEYVRDVVLTDARELSEFFDRQKVELALSAHFTGRANYTDEIDKLMTISRARDLLFAT